MKHDLRYIGCGQAIYLTIMQHLNTDDYTVGTMIVCRDCAAEFRGKAVIVTDQKAGIDLAVFDNDKVFTKGEV